MSRGKKLLKNLSSEILPQILIMGLGLIKSKFFLDYLGENTVGLTQIFNQILGYLSLVEGGLGQAVIYRLYNPVNKKNYKKISEIGSGTKSIFNKIILIILVLSIIGGLIIPFLIKDNPYSTIYILFNFILYVISEIILYTTVFERSLYIASEKAYKSNRIIKSSLIIKYLLEILFAFLFKDITIIFVSLIIISIIENVLIKIITKKDFKYLEKTEEKDTEVLNDVKNLMVHKIAGLIATNIDIILISSFIGLSKVLIYSTYLMYFNAIVSLTNKISRGMVGTIGNIIVEDKDKSYNAFKEFNGFVFLTCLLIAGPFAFLINHFINIFYDGKVLTSTITSVLFTLVLIYNIIRIPLTTYTEGAGLFKETKICPIIESIVNLGLSLILIQFWGINGCLLGTFISLIISEYIIKPSILFKKIFNRKSIAYYKISAGFILLLIIQLAISSAIQNYIVISNFKLFFGYAIFFFVINLIIILIIFKIFRQNYVFERLNSIKNIIFKKE